MWFGLVWFVSVSVRFGFGSVPSAQFRSVPVVFLGTEGIGVGACTRNPCI